MSRKIFEGYYKNGELHRDDYEDRNLHPTSFSTMKSKFKIGDVIRFKPYVYNNRIDLRKFIVDKLSIYDDIIYVAYKVHPSYLSYLSNCSFSSGDNQDDFQLYSKPITITLKLLSKSNQLFFDKKEDIKYMKENNVKCIKKLR